MSESTEPRDRTAQAVLAAFTTDSTERDPISVGFNAADGLYAVANAIEHLAQAVYRIAYGSNSGPTGLEAVAMAINGADGPGTNSVSQAIGTGLGEISEAIREGFEGVPGAAS